jgi:hypothetical protein
VARPTGVGRAISTYTIPIEGRDEWLAAAWRRSGLTTEQLIYSGRALGWLVVPSLEPA